MSASAPIPRQAVIFGEALVDVFQEGDVAGGAPFNVARHLAALGLQPRFISRLGDDARGAMLRAELARFGMDLTGVQTDRQHATGEVQVDESAPGVHRFTILPDMAWDYIAADEAEQALLAWPDPPALLYYGSLAQRSAISRAAVTRLRSHHPGIGWCDLNWREGHVTPDDALAIVHSARALKVNEGELHMVLGWLGLRDAALAARPAAGRRSAAVAALCAGGSVERVLVTYGADGYAAFNRDGVCEVAAPAAPLVRMVDTVGSGDAFTAIVIAGELCAWPLATTLERANAFAAALCGMRGAAPEDLGFYAPLRRAWGLAG